MVNVFQYEAVCVRNSWSDEKSVVFYESNKLDADCLSDL